MQAQRAHWSIVCSCTSFAELWGISAGELPTLQSLGLIQQSFGTLALLGTGLVLRRNNNTNQNKNKNKNKNKNQNRNTNKGANKNKHKNENTNKRIRIRTMMAIMTIPDESPKLLVCSCQNCQGCSHLAGSLSQTAEDSVAKQGSNLIIIVIIVSVIIVVVIFCYYYLCLSYSYYLLLLFFYLLLLFLRLSTMGAPHLLREQLADLELDSFAKPGRALHAAMNLCILRDASALFWGVSERCGRPHRAGHQWITTNRSSL